MTHSGGSRRVVVTGMGAVTPIGSTVADFWAGCRRAQVGVGELTGFPIEDLKILIAAQVKDFDPKVRLKDFKRDKIIQYADRYSWFGAAAADEAVKMAGLKAPFSDPYRVACIIGSGGAGLVAVEDAYRDLFIKKKKATNPLTLIRIIGSSAAAHVGIELGVKGPVFATCSACSTAAHAIGIGRDYIRHGLVDVAIAGAAEAAITYGTMRAWQAMHVLSPQGIFPFAKKRNGTVLGEGAGILVLESLEHARARGATILAELAGFGMTADSKDMVNPDIDGPKEAMRQARAVRHRLPQRARHRDRDQRHQRDRRHQEGVRRPRQEARHLLDQVDARPSLGRRWRHRGRRLHQGDERRLGAAHGRPRRAGSQVRPRLCAQRRARAEGHLRHVELVRLRRAQRGPGVRPAARVTARA
jgi:nodulation protein E